MLLDGKNAVIYGAGGSIGGAVARAFAREGAHVHLTGRTLASLDAVAEQIRSAGAPLTLRASTLWTSRRSTSTWTRSLRRPAASTSP